jgi:hypothetical protein
MVCRLKKKSACIRYILRIGKIRYVISETKHADGLMQVSYYAFIFGMNKYFHCEEYLTKARKCELKFDCQTRLYLFHYELFKGTRQRSWLKHYATSRKVAGSIHDEVIGFFLICLILPAALWSGCRLSL